MASAAVLKDVEDVDQQENTHGAKLKKISNEADTRKMRDDIDDRSMASSTLATENNRTGAHRTVISKSSDSLIRESKKDFPEFESMGQIEAGDSDTTVGGIVRITRAPESVVDMEGVETKGWDVKHMKSTDDGSIVITGNVDNEHTHITVIDRDGKLISTDQINQRKCDDGKFFPTCSPHSLFKVVTTCMDGNIGIYNTQTRSHIRKHMSDIVGVQYDHTLVFSVATDQINRNVYVAGNSRYVFVLDDKLNYRHKLQRPQGSSVSFDMVIHDDNLIVCDYKSKKAYIVTREGPGTEQVCELPKPDHMGGDWTPGRVCTDSNDFIYIIWGGVISCQRRCLLTQYSPHGHHLLITKYVEDVVFGIDTVLTDGSEKMLLVTEKGKLYTYGLDIKT